MQLKNGTIFLEDIHQAVHRAWIWAMMDIHQYGLPDNLNNKQSFDILTHHVLKNLCDDIVDNLKLGCKVILYHQTSGVDEIWIDGLPDRPDVRKAMERIGKLIPRVIPAYVIQTELDKHTFIKKFKNDEVWAVTHVEKAIAQFDKNAFKPFNLNKIINYLKRRGLKYLSDDYFQQANNKILAANK